MNDKDAKTMASKTAAANINDDLTLKLWDGDESAKGELLIACGGRVEVAIKRAFPALSAEDAEDVVGEAIRRFWIWRDKFNPTKAKLFTMLYKFADQVGVEYRTGRLKWQQAQIMERGVDAEFFQRVAAPEPAEEPSDDSGTKPSAVQRALAECFGALSDLQKDILQRFADARGYEIDAATVGKDLGDKHKGGVPIPGGTIRTNRSRAWESLDACMKKKNFDLGTLGYTDE